MNDDCPICAKSRAEGWNGLADGTFHCGHAPRAGVVGCHATWTGRARVHTLCCHRTFSTDTGEQRLHGRARTKLHRCPTDAELAERGAVCRDGLWGWPSPKTEPPQRIHGNPVP